jgi:hypothetical protein
VGALWAICAIQAILGLLAAPAWADHDPFTTPERLQDASPEGTPILFRVEWAQAVRPQRGVIAAEVVGTRIGAKMLVDITEYRDEEGHSAFFKLITGSPRSHTAFEVVDVYLLRHIFPQLHDEPLEMLDSGKALSLLGEVDYYRFTRPWWRYCFAIVPLLSQDPRGAPVTLDAYYCQEGEELSHAEIRAILARVGVKGYPERRR